MVDDADEVSRSRPLCCAVRNDRVSRVMCQQAVQAAMAPWSFFAESGTELRLGRTFPRLFVSPARKVLLFSRGSFDGRACGLVSSVPGAGFG